MKWTTKFTTVDIDMGKYKRALDDYMQETIKDAAKSWLRTVLVIIPTWSRASRATFEALANEVGFNVTYGPQRSRKDRLLLGMQSGDGGLKIKKNQSYRFFYTTSLRYLIYNEYNKAVPGPPPQPYTELIHDTPYKFQDAGEKDFRSYAENYVKLPNPLDYQTRKKL